MAISGYDPILSWSYSRNLCFDTCHRKYFFRYYQKHLASELKQIVKYCDLLSNRALCIGSVTHQAYEALLKRIQVNVKDIHDQKLSKYILDLLYKYARKHYIDEVVNMQISLPEFIKEVADQVEAHVHELRYSDIFLDLSRMPQAARQEWTIEDWDDSRFAIDGYKVIALVDMSYTSDEKRVIIDWKTGSPWDEYTVQMQVYAYAYYQRGVCAENIELRNYYTADMNHPVVKSPSVEEMKKIKAYIISQTESMYDMLIDTRKNIPKPLADFEKTENTKACEKCQYKSVCYGDSSLSEIKE